MSVRFLQLFVSSLRQNLPRPSNIIRSGIQIRFISIMSATEQIETKNDDLVQNKNHTRYKRRFLKRQWESGGKKTEDGESDEKKICGKPLEKIKKKKMAMLLGYCGVNYYGMQRNPGVPTIEEDLLKALYDANYITEGDFKNQQNAHFQRSSRTDKGVSAARQVVSLKLPLEVNIEEINSRLPSCIKVFAIKRATNKFNSKSKCNARTYSYTLPTYVFEPSMITKQERKTYRISAEKMTKVNEVLEFYKGTKSYHNFTEKKHYQDPSSLRYMMSFKLERLFHECEMEFAELLVKGQSFMLHQIRKMVGLMITVVRGQTDMGMLEKAFSNEKVMIPTAPGLGLVLDKVHYERYDAKYKDTHESLSWDEQDEAVETFKREQIFPIIVKGEIEENSMGIWLDKIKGHSFEPSDEVVEDQNEVIADDDADDDDDDDDENGMNIDTTKVDASEIQTSIEIKSDKNNEVVESNYVVTDGDESNVKDSCENKGDEIIGGVESKDVVVNSDEKCDVKVSCQIKGDEIKSSDSAVN